MIAPIGLPPWLRAVMLVSTLLYAVANLHAPVGILAGANFDDGLFFDHARQILQGHWLGPFSQMTLAKGPGYPLFLALNALLGLPITLTQALLYAAGCAVVGSTLFRLSGRPVLTLVGFLAMQWHPAIFAVNVIRDDISATQVLLILGCFGRGLFVPEGRSRRLAWAILGGLSLGWFWMTREDAVWVLPGLVTLVLLHMLRQIRVPRALLATGALALCFGVAALLPLASVATVNRSVYGAFEVVDFKSPSFTRALDILQSVRVGPPVPYIPVPYAVRQAVDKVSPSFARVDAYLTGQGRGWLLPGCHAAPFVCNDFAGGWFVWAFRDAVAAQGAYASPQAAAGFYRRLWGEIHAACVSGALTCRSTPIAFMPAMRKAQWAGLPQQAYALAVLATSQMPLGAAPPSSGDAAQINEAVRLLGYPRRTWSPLESGTVSISGWFMVANDSWIRVRCDGPQGPFYLPVLPQPSPDIEARSHKPSNAARRFVLTVPSRQGCGVEPAEAGAAGGYRSFASLALGPNPYAGGTIYFDNMVPVFDADGATTAQHWLERLNRLYGLVMPAAATLGLLAYLCFGFWSLLRRRAGDLGPLFLWASAVWLLLLARAAVLVLVSLSSFPAITQLYWQAGFPLLCLAIVLSLAAPWDPAGRCRPDPG